MKYKDRRRSKNVEIQTPQQKQVAEKGLELQTKVLNSPRARLNEPVAYNQDKTPTETMIGAINNPGRRSHIKKRDTKDPAPSKFEKARSNYDELPFLEHKSKGK